MANSRTVVPYHRIALLLVTLALLASWSMPAFAGAIRVPSSATPPPPQGEWVETWPDPAQIVGDSICSPDRKGNVKGLLIGIQKYPKTKFPDLDGSSNDVALLNQAILERYPAASVTTLRNEQGTTDNIRSVLRRLGVEAQCGDFVVFYYSGHSRLTKTLGNGYSYHLMGVDAENEGNGGVIPALELSQLLTSIRNRGSHVLAVIDTSHAAALRLVENQEPLNIWSYKKMLPEEITPKAEERITLRPGAGGLSVFYASKDVQQAGEYERTDGKSYGLFSYSLAAALTTADPGASVRTLALKTKEYMGHVRETRQHPVYQSTDPDAPILAPQQPSSGLKLELHDPPVTRGAIRIGKNKFTVKGRIKQPGKIVDLSINFRSVKPADFDRKTGEFTMRDVEMKPGQNELSVLATFSDFHKEVMVIPVAVEGNLEQIVGSGKQYVLTIANSDYSKTSYTVLKTPGNDVKEISTLLAGQYGFASSIKDRDGNQHNLTLVDASRDKITEVMEVLVDALRPEDSLLVYYAGHGIYDETSQQAFWVPVDGSRRTKLISADELTTRFFANMQARHVLVVSDSCYSGALSRGGDTVKERTGEDRSRYIERMLAKQTRQLLSSGNNEPVADGGGNNHSIFAQALIEGLQEMDETLFTVSDLFYGHIKTRVAGARSANQSPQLQMIKKSGDEGGEFVFKKKKALGTP